MGGELLRREKGVDGAGGAALHRCSALLLTLSLMAHSGGVLPGPARWSCSHTALHQRHRTSHRISDIGAITRPGAAGATSPTAHTFSKPPRAGKTVFTGTRVAPSRISNGSKARMAQWLDNRAEVEVPVPLEVCWALWDDRERIPQWMPWIKSVKVLEEDSRLSRWTLSTQQFGR
jgi:hypothetical protein